MLLKPTAGESVNTNQKLFLAGVVIVGLSIMFAPILLQKYKVSDCVSAVQKLEAQQYGGNHSTPDDALKFYCLRVVSGGVGN